MYGQKAILYTVNLLHCLSCLIGLNICHAFLNSNLLKRLLFKPGFDLTTQVGPIIMANLC